MVGKVAFKRLKTEQLFNKTRVIMTTETATITLKNAQNNSSTAVTRPSSMLTKLEERKGNAIKALSLRPTRSFKKNGSLKPLGLKSR
jgi:hypothetical protein